MNQAQQIDLLPVAESICSANSLSLNGALGQGSYKQAYLAEGQDGKRYALKIISDPIPSPRTQREIESLRICDHDSIAKLYHVDAHAFNGVHYQFLIEEYLPGGTLTERIALSDGLEEVEIAKIAHSLIDALAHLEELGLVHRDIKPDNILFRDQSSTPVLVDFGCVRDLSASSITRTWAPRGPGTPYFSSPEQLNNQKPLINWRSDQFSLGITLFYARFLSHPYQYPDEPVFDIETVNRAAEYGERRSDLSQLLNNSTLVPLETMTAPWPVERYRIPIDLAEAWSSN